jgi:hypothetical protein
MSRTIVNPAAQHLDAVGNGLDRPQRRGIGHIRVVVDIALRLVLVGECQVVVRVHQTRQHGHRGEIDHVRAGGDLDGWTDLADAAVLHEDDLVGGNRSRFGIDETPGADGGHG